MTPEEYLLRRALVQADGLQSSVMGLGRGPAVLSCHDFPDTAEIRRHQIRMGAEAGYRALAPGMRVYGDSYLAEAEQGMNHG